MKTILVRLNHIEQSLAPKPTAQDRRMAALARLSHFGGFAQGNLLKFGKTEAKVFTTAKAGWRARFQEVEGYATP
jgi:hypothetical protein